MPSRACCHVSHYLSRARYNVLCNVPAITCREPHREIKYESPPPVPVGGFRTRPGTAAARSTLCCLGLGAVLWY
eukprot:2795267-Rhodomonas_salina.4